MKRFVFLLLILFVLPFISYSKDIPFTQDDRERLLRLEEGQKAINQRFDDVNKRFDDVNRRFDDVNRRFDDVNKRFDDVNKRIDDLREEVKGLRDLLYVVIGGIFVLIGFVIWDRRSALAPAIRKTKELEEREERIEKALKELAKKDPKVEEALKNAGIL